ncbi:MAG TPA: MFS transporter [Nocardioidaceae bacterium]|nr:MFS transporter [Nocardioidaceae bacterium]
MSHAAAAVGMSMPWPLLLVWVWDRSAGTAHGELLLGLAGGARMLPYVLLSWATGRLADRFRRDRLLRTTLLARLVLLLLLATAVAHQHVLAAVACATLAVAAGTPAYPALAAAMPAVAGPACRRATDLLVTVEVASFTAGPALGGLLLAGPARPFVGVLAVGLTGLALVAVRGIVLTRPESGARSCLDRGSEGPEERSGGGAERPREGTTAQRAGHARAQRAQTAQSGARSCLDRASEAAEERSGGAVERVREGATHQRAGHARAERAQTAQRAPTAQSGARSCLDRGSEGPEERSGGGAERPREGTTAQRAGHARAQRAPTAERAGHARAQRAQTAESIAVAAAVNAVVAATTLTLLPVVERTWHGDGTGYGVATAALGLGGLGAPLLWWLGQAAGTRWRRAMLASGLAVGLLGLVPALAWALPVLLVLGAASVQVEGAVTETLQDAVPDERRAGVLGLADSVMVGAAMLASLLTPWLVGLLGPGALLLAMATGCTVVAGRPRRSPQREPEVSFTRGSRPPAAAA